MKDIIVVSSQGQVVIPKKFREQLSLVKGKVMTIEVKNKTLVLKGLTSKELE